MDRETEFQKNTEYDRFALYLRPLDSDGQPLYVSEASEAQKRWGGLHVTLCGFAPKKGSGAPQTHPASLVETLSKAFLAVKATAKPGENHWSLKSDSTLPLVGSKLMLYPRENGELCNTLSAISETVTSSGLLNARAAETLHVSIGHSDPTSANITQVDATRAARVRTALAQVKRWELVIAKCQTGTMPLQVTEFRESKELMW